jgi:hypothetical protein
MTDVQKLVHLMMRMVDSDRDTMRAELQKQRIRAYEDELTIQAGRVGCGGRRGRLVNGPALSDLNDMSITDAASIVNTYNYDLAAAILAIASDTPTANRNTYVKRLGAWEAKRREWKRGQIAQFTENSARSQAQQDFYRLNNIGGVAELQPESAECPVCQGWVQRGEVPLRVAENNPPPYHQNCPHSWACNPDKVAKDECRDLWMGE